MVCVGMRPGVIVDRVWTEIHSSARSDDLLLRHWQKSTVVWDGEDACRRAL